MDNRTKHNNPENDADKKLSKAYGELLDGKKSESDIEDPLFKTLSDAREKDLSDQEDFAVTGKEQTWDSILESIGEKRQTDRRPAKIHRIGIGKKVLRVAAAILLIAAASLLVVQQFSESGPVLLAESEEAIHTVELIDGSSVTLRPQSKLFALSQTDGQQRYSLSGEALFTVESSPDRIFSVEAGEGRVVVTGTQFNLNDRDNMATVYLIEGSVRFETLDGSDSVDLQPGEVSQIGQNRQLLDPYTLDEEFITGWTRNRLTFRDRDASSIFNELEAHFDIEIHAPEATRQETLGGSIELNSAEQSLEDLGTVLGGSFVQTDESTYQFRSDQ